MVSLIDNLDAEVWQEIKTSERGDGWASYHINRQRKHEDPSTMALFLTSDDGEPIPCKLKGTQANCDPIKAVACCEFKVEGGEIIGIDLQNDDIVVKKS